MKGKTMRRFLLTLALSWVATCASAQSMVESIRAGWATYIFVSTSMPERDLVDLAREASQANATLVFRGFAPNSSNAINLQALQSLVAEIDQRCCSGKPVSWMVDPRLFERYRVQAVPAFVLAFGAGGPTEYSLVTGDMALANALKFFTQTSALPGVRAQAASVYAQAYGGRQ
jgi:conjugal transfer pilus assembly protein TrbC